MLEVLVSGKLESKIAPKTLALIFHGALQGEQMAALNCENCCETG